MRFKKASLVAASLLLSAIPALNAADINYGWVAAPGVTVLNAQSVVPVGPGDRAIINGDGRSGMINGFTGAGSVVINGGGIFRNDGFYEGWTAGSSSPVYSAENNAPIGHSNISASPEFLVTENALTGSITLNGGTFELSGRVNQWVEAPGNMSTGQPGNWPWSANNKSISGVTGIVLANGGTQLSFTNTGLNVANNVATQLGGPGGTVAYRYNIVRNIKAGADNSIVDTTLFTGVDSSYRIAIYADNTAAAIAQNAGLAALGDAGNSIGKLAGAGSIFKYGEADLKIIGDSERGLGSFTVAGGSVTLASTGGAALGTASAVNLAGTDSLQGQATAAIYKQNGNPQATTNNDYWINAVTPAPGVGTLIVTNNQIIRNLQADFAPGATGGTITDAIRNAANVTSVGEAVIAGTGVGSTINIGSNTLTIRQDRDGVYGGNIVATAGGTIVKTGDATLALLLGGETTASIRIEAGTVLANAQGLGTGTVQLAGGSLSIYQNNAGALKTQLQGAGNLDIVASALLNNGAGAIQLNSTGAAGTLSISADQSAFTGTFNVFDGVTVELTSAVSNAIRNAESFTLHGATNAVTTLRVAGGTHHVNRLSGAENTRIDLRDGELIVRQSGGDPLAFGGTVSGTGTLVQDGGSWSLNGAGVTSRGALVVRNGGALNVTGATGISTVSGVVLTAGSTLTTGGADTSIGALFGQSGSVIDIGQGTLTVGFSAARVANLIQDLAAGTPISSTYLGTGVTSAELNGAGVGAFDTSMLTSQLASVTHTGIAGATEAFLLRQYSNIASLTILNGAPLTLSDSGIIVAAPGGATLRTNAHGGALQLVNSNGVLSAAADAASLAFAGVIRGTGGLTKIGGETLTLTGVNTYTGATQVQGGLLVANWNSVSATSGIAVSAGATFAVNADAVTGDGTFNRIISGAGTFSKVGAGAIVLSSTFDGFTGTLSVDAGSLEVRTAGTFAGDIAIAAAGTMIYNIAGNATGLADISNDGILIKNGVGRLELGDYVGSGTVKVNEGTLSITNFPLQLEIAAGATFESKVIDTVNLSSQVQGAGLITLSGDNAGGADILVAQSNNLFSGVTLNLTNGVTFDLNSTSQTLGGFSGDATSSINLNNGSLAFDSTGNTTFSGNLTGFGALQMNGAGTLTLDSTATQNWTGSVTVAAGTLVATAQALNSNSVTLAGGTFAVHNADAAVATTYGSSITGTGTLAKTGVGEVILTSGVSGVNGAVDVRAGRLTTADGNTDAVFSSVVVASGASFRVNMSGDRLHDSTTTNAVTGAGSLAVSGPHTLTLENGVGYQGLTELLNGAKLAFVNTASIGGLAGETGTLVTLSADLTLNQSADAAYSGQFAGAGTLTVAGPGTLDLSAAGNAGELSGTAVAIAVTAGGSVKVSAINTLTIANEGDLGINVASGATQQYLGSFSGAGTLSKTGEGTLVFGTASSPYHLGNAGAFTIREGVVGGNFSTAGSLVVASGGTLAPGNSPGVVTVGGDFTLASGGTLAVEVNATTADRVDVTGAASLAGAVAVSLDNTPGAGQVVSGAQYSILTASNGVTGMFSNVSASGLLSLSAADAAAIGVARMHFGIVGDSVVMTAVGSLADVAGFKPHDGADGLVALLDSGVGSAPDLVPASVQTAIDGIWGSSINDAINNLTPMGFASEYAMAQDGEARRQSLLHERLEQRRYDRASRLTVEDAPWEAFVVGSAAFANNQSKTDTPTFNYNTFGGLVGLDRKINDDLLLGIAVSYDNGKADIHNGGGKVEMNRMAFTSFVSTQLNKRWYVDAGVSFGVGLFDTTRETVVGKATGDNNGFSGGFHVESGTIVVLKKDLHLTPYVGVAYTHHEFGSIDESGSDAALNVDSWSNDSLRLKVGTGLGWFLPTSFGRMKLGLDVAYSQEVLDTKSDLNARFKNGGASFKSEANALPDGAISLSPSIGIELDETTSMSFGYGFEYGLDSRTYQSLNFSVRKRF